MKRWTMVMSGVLFSSMLYAAAADEAAAQANVTQQVNAYVTQNTLSYQTYGVSQ